MSSSRHDLAGPVRGIVFDLDNCLAAADEGGRELFQPAFDAMRRASAGRVPDAVLARAFDDCWRHDFDFVARKHALPAAVAEAGFRAFAHIEVGERLHGYADIALLGEFSAKLLLLTAGFSRLQTSKIAALGISSRFAEVHIDAVDRRPRLGKEAIMRDILARHGWRHAELLVVGDNPDSELAAGKRIGSPTAQVVRPGVQPSDVPDIRVAGLEALLHLLQR